MQDTHSEDNTRSRGYGQLLTTYLRPQRLQVALLVLLLLAGIGLQLANPLILRSFIDTATTGGTVQVLVRIALLFLLVALVSQIVTVVETYTAENVGLIATNQLRATVMLHCLRLDPAFHSAHTPGELIERVDGDVATLGNFFSRFVVQLLGNALTLIGILVLLWRIDWRIGGALTLFTLLALLAINILRDFAVPHWAAARQSSAELFGFVEERLVGTEDIRANGAIDYMLKGLAEQGRTLLHTHRTAA